MVTITQADMVAEADPPTEREAGMLLSAVARRWPVLTVPNGERIGFLASLEFLQFAQRGPLNVDHGPLFFCDATRDWIRRRRGIDVRPTTRAFVAACVVSGVAYSALGHWPHGVNIGLSSYGMSGSPRSIWRNALSGVPEPSTD